MTSPFVSIHNLGKSYGDFQAVNGLSLDIDGGEIVALLGPNGAGKTTTIRMIMGILQPSQGSASVAGFDCFRDRARVMEQVGYMPDEPAFYDYLRGREIIHFCGEMRGLSACAINQRAQPLAARLGLEGDLEEYAMNYSQGMKKKLAAIAAFLHNPSLLVLDEPTNGLDPYAIRAFHELVRERANEGAAIIYSTHLLDQAEKLCTRAGILFNGQLAADGDLADLRSSAADNQSLEEIFFHVTAAPTAAPVTEGVLA
jgi:ABC-2 type transport system ATP-binding protein